MSSAPTRARRALPLVMLTVALAAAPRARAQEAALGVEDAVAAALARQPRLKAAESQVAAAGAQAREAAWKRFGELSTTLLYTPEQKPLSIDFAGIPPLVPPMSFDVTQLRTYSATATYTLPLWTWGALHSERSARRRAEAAALGSLDRARQDVALAARRAYYQAAAGVAAVGVAAEAQEQQRAFLSLTRLRAEAGAAARLDVLKGELALARAESDAIEAQSAEHLAREALVTTTSDERFRSAPLRALEDDAAELPPEADAVALALRRRPDLAAWHSQIAAARLAGDATHAARWPAVAFRGQLTQQHDSLGEVLGKDGQLYTLSLGLNWDLTQALRGGAAVAERRAVERGLVHAASAAEAEAALQVRAALARVRSGRERVAVQRRAVTVAEEQARVARLAYGEGVITSVEAQDAELGLSAARLALLRARLDAALAQAEVEHALGSPWGP